MQRHSGPQQPGLWAQGGDLYPIVAVQLPMCNERAVCQAAIDHACRLDWPAARLVIQVPSNPTSILSPTVMHCAG